jgi:fatty-acyl-CoA synthase
LYRRSSGQLDCAYDFDELAGGATAQAHALADQMERATQASDLAMVKYTSGSTAFPKGVMLEQGGIVANAVLHSRRMGVGRSDVYFSMMPFFHAGGSIYGLMTMLVHGGTLVFTETFNAALAADLIVAEQGTVFVTMLGDEVVQAALSSYRPGEAASICNGSLLEGNEGRIVDPETGKDVSTGTPGELLLRGNIARGYWNKPVETARAFTQDGWFRTEDLVSMNADGYLTWHGRVKLMLKVGGENVSIEEVERVVTSHDTVAECGAVGMPDKRKGEAIRLYVRASPGQALNEEDLRAWLKPRVAHFKLPREIVFVDSLPHLGSGKIDRVQLAQWAKALSQP